MKLIEYAIERLATEKSAAHGVRVNLTDIQGRSFAEKRRSRMTETKMEAGL